jgi:hypothetical protein
MQTPPAKKKICETLDDNQMANCVAQNNTTPHHVPVKKIRYKLTPVFLQDGNYDQNYFHRNRKPLHTIYYDPSHAANMRDHLNGMLLGKQHPLHAANKALPNTFQIQSNNSTKTGAIKASRHFGLSHLKAGSFRLVKVR